MEIIVFFQILEHQLNSRAGLHHPQHHFQLKNCWRLKGMPPLLVPRLNSALRLSPADLLPRPRPLLRLRRRRPPHPACVDRSVTLPPLSKLFLVSAIYLFKVDGNLGILWFFFLLKHTSPMLCKHFYRMGSFALSLTRRNISHFKTRQLGSGLITLFIIK